MRLMTIDVADGVATILLNNPDSPVNIVSPEWIDEMTAAIDRLRADGVVQGIVIASAKPGFMAGADLKYIHDRAASMTPAEAFEFSQRATQMHRLLETCGKPVVAAMTGFALGGGYELALACTHRVLADSRKAEVGLPEVHVGLLPGSGGTQRLPRMIGVAKAAEILLEGKSYRPGDALAIGLVDEVVPSDQVLEVAKAWIRANPESMRAWDRKGFLIAESDGLLKQSTAGFFSQATARVHARYGDNYPAPIAILSCLFEGIQVPMDKALRVESRYFAQLLTGSVSRNIIRTTFIRKGLAEKGAHRPSGIPKSEIQRIGVLGAGMMGAGVAYVAARSGLGVVLLDVSVETARAGKSYSEKLLAKQAEKGSTRPDEAGALLDRIHPTQDYAALRDVDLIIEAVYEDVAVKATVTQRAAGAMRPGALFASNTSTLPITGLAQSYAHPANFIGLHFFSPVDRMDLVEVIMGRQTSQVALAKALDFIARIRKTPILVNDSRGFFTSRVFQTFIHEGMHLLNEGVVPALIENVARQAGLPMGPLEVTDEVTLDLPLKIVRESEQADPTYRKPASTVVLETMVDKLNRHGKKGGAGFYEHPVGGKKRLWPGLAHYFPVAPEQPGAEEVRKRLLYVQALDTARCLEEGVLTRAADGDLGGVLGWGFPRWTGGPLSLIEAVGVANFVSDCELMAKHYGERFAPTAQLRTMAATGKGFDSL